MNVVNFKANVFFFHNHLMKCNAEIYIFIKEIN